MSDYIEIDSGTAAYGIRWAVGLDHGALKVEAPGVILDGAERERFVEAVARAVTPGQAEAHSCRECIGEGVIPVDSCTCGAGPGGYYGAHEPGCGFEPCPAGCAVPRG